MSNKNNEIFNKNNEISNKINEMSNRINEMSNKINEMSTKKYCEKPLQMFILYLKSAPPCKWFG